MHCICCLSNDLKHQPLGFEDFFSCPNCGLLFQSQNKPTSIQSSIVEHYQDDDPHSRVADSKFPFFKHAIGYQLDSCGKTKNGVFKNKHQHSRECSQPTDQVNRRTIQQNRNHHYQPGAEQYDLAPGQIP